MRVIYGIYYRRGGAAGALSVCVARKDDQLCEYFSGGDRAADSNAAADIVRIPVDEIEARTELACFKAP
jgi:hypothetical protein